MLPAPYHLMPTDSWVFWLGMALSILGIAFHGTRERTGVLFEPDDANTETRHRWRFIFIYVAAAWLLIHAQFAAHAWFLIGGDEYSRVGLGFEWARRPYFVTHDLIWLAGHFYILGSLYWLIEDMRIAMLLSSVFGVLATMYWTGGLAVRLWGRLEAGVIAAFAAGVHWIMLWGSVNPLADVFFFPALMFCLDRFAAYWNQEVPRNTMPLFFMGVAIGFGNMFRFESWYVGILVGGFLLVMSAIHFMKGSPRAWIAPMLGALCDAAYPIAHLYASWKIMGSPTQFLENARAMNEVTNLFYQTETVWQRFIAYPTVAWADHFYLFPLMVGSVVLALLAGHRQRGMPVALAVSVIWLFSMLVSIKSGIGSNNRPRYTMFLLLPLISFLPGVLVALWVCSMPVMRWIPRLAVVALLLLLVTSSLQRAFKLYTNSYEMRGEDIAFVSQLEREHDTFGRAAASGAIQPRGVRIGVFSNGDYNVFEAIRYHTRAPLDVFWLEVEEELLQNAAYRDPTVHFAVRGSLNNEEILSETHERVLTTGTWGVWRLRK